MRKYCLVLFSCLFVCCATSPAWSYMPSYPDDEEFKVCTKVNSWDECAREEYQRALRVVKQQYRTILTTPSIMKWHPSADENVAVLRDMYDSWSAFRTRLCSLSSKATQYVEPLVDEKTTCNLYYTLHHKDHLNNILLLMTRQAPSNQNEFGFLTIYDHDDEYQTCMEEKEPDCLAKELQRANKSIKDYYKTFSEDEFVGKWNNGPDLKKGNYRDMYDSWIAYRNRMCSLAVWAYQGFYGEKSMDLTHCLQYLTREKLETMDHLLIVAHSTLDEWGEGEDAIESGNGSAVNNGDDGGLEEGRTITPLEHRIDAGTGNSDDELVPEEPKTEEVEQEKPEDKYDIPEWAR